MSFYSLDASLEAAAQFAPAPPPAMARVSLVLASLLAVLLFAPDAYAARGNATETVADGVVDDGDDDDAPR